MGMAAQLPLYRTRYAEARRCDTAVYGAEGSSSQRGSRWYVSPSNEGVSQYVAACRRPAISSHARRGQDVQHGLQHLLLRQLFLVW